MAHEHSGGWRTFAVYHQPDDKGVCVRASSLSPPTDAERIEIELWTNYRWGNCRMAAFEAALIQAPLRPTAVPPAHLLALAVPGARYKLKLPVRFVVVIPDEEFGRFGFDGFRLYRAGVFDFAADFDPTRPDRLAPARPPVRVAPPALDPSSAEMSAALDARSPVLLQAQCLTPEAWAPLERVWEGCVEATRRGAAFFTQTFSQDTTALDWCLACQYVEGRSWASAAADWNLVAARRRAVRPGDSGLAEPVGTAPPPPVAPPALPATPTRPARSRRGFAVLALRLAVATAAFAGWRESEYRSRAAAMEGELERLRADLARRPTADDPLPRKWADAIVAAQLNNALATSNSEHWAGVAATKAREAKDAAAAAARHVADANEGAKRALEAVTRATAAANEAEAAAKKAKESAKPDR